MLREAGIIGFIVVLCLCVGFRIGYDYAMWRMRKARCESQRRWRQAKKEQHAQP